MKKSKNARKIQEVKIVNLVRRELSSAADWHKNRNIGDIIRPEDDILKDNGYNFKIYRSLLNDEQVKACYINQRIAGIVAAPWEVIPASDSSLDKEIAEFVRFNLDKLKFNEICRKMLYASWYGFQIGEVLWEVEYGKIIIKDIKVRRNERFAFGKTGELFLQNNFLNKELMPERKFWVLKNSGDNDDDIYGVGLGHICYWPVYLKRNGLKFWSVLVEKFAVPTAIGKYNPQATDDEIQKILEAMDSIASETSIAVPEGTVVELLEAYKSSGGDHEKFCFYLDKIIAKAILGQDGTSQNGAYVGTAEVHEDVKTLILKSDADLLCESFNEVIKWLVAYNWPEAEAPTVIRHFEKSANMKDEAGIYQIMHLVGYRPTLQQVIDKFGGEWEAAAEYQPENFQPQPADFAEAADEADVWEKVMAPVVQPIEEIVNGCSSFEELEQKLLQVYPQMDVSKFAELLAQSDFAERMRGSAGEKHD